LPARLNIAALTQRTGVPPDTIRKWEQRYGVLRPERTPGGQRHYSARDVARVQWLKERLNEGYRIGEAAALLGDSETVARTGEELRDGIVAATAASDAAALRLLVDQSLALTSLHDAFVDVLAPALSGVGVQWACGEINVAQEHLASSTVRAALLSLLSDRRGDVRGTAVLACAPGERHEIGLLMLAVLLRSDGWQVAYLGADTPAADAVALAERTGARLLCISATMPDSAERIARELPARRLPQGLAVVLGGRAMTGEAAATVGARYVNGDLRRGVGALRRLSR
jgi:MerR family transcriptional regulator, light-induced transcriptional regulator